MNAVPSVSILISTRNRKDSLQRTLDAASAQDHASVEILVADNESTDGTAEMVKHRFPEARFLPMNENAGFAKAINRAAAAAKGDIQLSLPDDVILEPSYVSELVSAMLTTGAAAAGGVLLEWPETSRVNYAGAEVSRILRLRFERRHLPTGREPRDTGFIPGGNLAVRRSVFNEVGGFDGDYASFFEDIDFCMRARMAGHRLILAPAARAYHITHPVAASYHREFYDRRNLWIFFFKQMTNPALLAAFMIYEVFLAFPRDVARAILRRDRVLLKSAFYGNLWWTRHFGELLVMRRRARKDHARLAAIAAARAGQE